MKRIAQGIAAGTLVAWLACSFLPFFNPGNGGGPNLWEATSLTDVVLTLIALIAIGCLVTGTIMNLRWTAAVGAAGAAFIAGKIVDLEAETFEIYDAGYWMLTILAIGALVLSLMAAVWPEAARAAPAPAAPARVPAPPPATEPATTTMAALPATPGWYPDPQGGGGLRLWSGSHWTEETKGPGQP